MTEYETNDRGFPVNTGTAIQDIHNLSDALNNPTSLYRQLDREREKDMEERFRRMDKNIAFLRGYEAGRHRWWHDWVW